MVEQIDKLEKGLQEHQKLMKKELSTLKDRETVHEQKFNNAMRVIEKNVHDQK